MDGGASHNVYYSPEVPEGAVKKEVELAHGTKIGYVKGADITFVDKARTLKESRRPTIISLGRLIQQGIKLVWTKDKTHLLLPSERKVSIPVCNSCPYAKAEVLKILYKFVQLKQKGGM